jgi:hypothetical protein
VLCSNIYCQPDVFVLVSEQELLFEQFYYGIKECAGSEFYSLVSSENNSSFVSNV